MSSRAHNDFVRLRSVCVVERLCFCSSYSFFVKLPLPSNVSCFTHESDLNACSYAFLHLPLAGFRTFPGGQFADFSCLGFLHRLVVGFRTFPGPQSADGLIFCTSKMSLRTYISVRDPFLVLKHNSSLRPIFFSNRSLWETSKSLRCCLSNRISSVDTVSSWHHHRLAFWRDLPFLGSIRCICIV